MNFFFGHIAQPYAKPKEEEKKKKLWLVKLFILCGLCSLEWRITKAQVGRRVGYKAQLLTG